MLYLKIKTSPPNDEEFFISTEITANFGKFLESSIISKKHDILNIILSNSKTDEKKLVYSITKPFDKLLKP